VSAARASTAVAATVLAGLGALHVSWGFGGRWPLPDRVQLADAVAGRAAAPSPAACFAVAGALATAAALVAGRPRRAAPVRRLGAGAVVATFTARGVAGLAGRTDLLAPGSSSARFRELDRRYYSPLCLAIAGLAVPATRRAPS
jgi:hypothetical protein